MNFFSLIKVQTSILRIQVYHIDPINFYKKVIDQRIKGTLGITGL